MNEQRRRQQRAPFVQLPCAVIDEIMPTLRDTEFRILLVVFRQTTGFRLADGKPKERDWLSHTQLRQRTGRASEAVSSAVDALVQRGLLCVQDQHGRELATSQERRRIRGRLYYALGPLFNSLASRSLKTEIGKSKTTTEAFMPVYSPFRFPEDSIHNRAEEATAAASADSSDQNGVLKQTIRDRLASLSN